MSPPTPHTAPNTPHSAPLVTRFAPSPTGHLHVGGARTALFCWAFAQAQGGRFMIRIEDTDQARSSDESARGILEDLAWLGILWNDGPTLTTSLGAIGAQSRPVGPYFQAQRLGLYNQYLEALVRAGRAYPAFESAQEIDVLRQAAVTAKKTFRYPRPADVVPGVFPAERWARAQAGEAHVVRFVAPAGEVVVNDQILGPVRFAPGEMDDFVVRKTDGFPTYHFAVVVDDELMGVTHVLRAQEHLINTPRHVALQQAMTRLDTGARFATPVYGHMPLIFNMDGTKMSKRDKAKAARKAAKDALTKNPALNAGTLAAATGLAETAVSAFLNAESDDVNTAEAVARHFKVGLPEIEVYDFRASGYLPEAITNFLALLGWSPGMKDAAGKDVEKFDMAFLAKHFSIDRIGKKPAQFDRTKLLSFNADAIKALPDAVFAQRLGTWAAEFNPAFAAQLAALPEAARTRLLAVIKPRCRTLGDAPGVCAFALVSDQALAFDATAMDKAVRTDAGRAVLRAFATALPGLNPTEPAAVDAWVKAHAEAGGMKMGEVAQPVRIALTGGTVSPPLGDVVAVLGTASSLARVERCLAQA